MATIGDVKVRISATIKGLQVGLKAAEKRLNSFAKRTNKIGQQASRNLTAPLALVGGAALKSFADLEKLTTGFTAVFNDTAGNIGTAAEELENLRKVAQDPGLSFQQAVQGSLNLQAVGFSADQSRETLSAFGNALALVGKGAVELDGVTLALQQIAAKGKISAEEINQIGERVPQIRTALKNAFGTASSEELQKLGISAEQFVIGVTEQLQKLPTATGGLSNSFENLRANLSFSLAQIGEDINETFDIQGVVDRVSAFLTRLVDGFKSLSDGAKQGIIIFAGLLAAIGPVALAISGLTAIVSALGVAINIALSPVTAVIVTILSLAAAAIFVKENFTALALEGGRQFGKLRNFVARAVNNILKSIDDFVEGITGFDLNLSEKFSIDEVDIPDPAKFKSLGQSLKDFGKEALDSLGIFKKQAEEATKATETLNKEVTKTASVFSAGLGAARPETIAPVETITPGGQLSTIDDTITFGDAIARESEKARNALELVDTTTDFVTSRFENLNGVGGELANVFSSIANSSETNFGKMGKAALKGSADVIRGSLSSAIAGYIASLLTSLGPLGLVAASLAGVVVSGLCNNAISALNIPALATGGLAFGPTLALVGDNRNAGTDPEVIAPLSKLKNFLQAGDTGFVASTRISGSDLELIVNRAVDRKLRTR